MKELKQFIEKDIVTTKEVGCTRQNIKQLVDYGKLVPIKETSRECLFLKDDS
ncbi:DNA-binding protein [Peribacillus sp. NJ4]|nr:DNA-binding protein [Peribacillus sp. NJ4]MDM5213260.1 DNA-binding protein [Peribacillus sp. NJ4]